MIMELNHLKEPCVMVKQTVIGKIIINGNLKIEGNRKNFLLDSIWKFYSERGKITKAINYSEGKKNGFVLTYDTNQLVTNKEIFMNDIKQGNSVSYYHLQIHLLL